MFSCLKTIQWFSWIPVWICMNPTQNPIESAWIWLQSVLTLHVIWKFWSFTHTSSVFLNCRDIVGVVFCWVKSSPFSVFPKGETIHIAIYHASSRFRCKYGMILDKVCSELAVLRSDRTHFQRRKIILPISTCLHIKHSYKLTQIQQYIVFTSTINAGFNFSKLKRSH